MVDGIGFNGITPKDLYNKVQGNKAEFVEQWQAEYKSNPFIAAKIYNYVASMDTDGTPGLTREEYKQGLTEKKDLAEIKREKIVSRHIPEGDLEKFTQMTQEEKLTYLESVIPHEPGLESEVNILAGLIISSLNRIDTEIGLINEELDIIRTEEEAEKNVK